MREIDERRAFENRGVDELGIRAAYGVGFATDFSSECESWCCDMLIGSSLASTREAPGHYTSKNQETGVTELDTPTGRSGSGPPTPFASVPSVRLRADLKLKVRHTT